jgi:hypothetical protein
VAARARSRWQWSLNTTNVFNVVTPDGAQASTVTGVGYRLEHGQREIIRSGLIEAIAIAACLAADVAAGPIEVGDGRQVFVDRTFLAESKGVDLVVHPPRKSGEKSQAEG